MTYKSIEIGIPTLSQVEECVSAQKLIATAQQIFEYWTNKDWLTKKGSQIKSLEIACSVCNGIVIQRARKKAKQKTIEEKHIIKRAQNKEKKVKKKNKRKNAYMAYGTQLHDERWLAFRQFIFNVRGKKCEVCGVTSNLQVHHLEYHPNKMAWEYTCKDVMVVCEKCHKKIHGIVD